MQLELESTGRVQGRQSRTFVSTLEALDLQPQTLNLNWVVVKIMVSFGSLL